MLKRRDTKLGERETKAYLNRPREEMFDLTADPHELKNLIAPFARQEVRDVLEDLRGKLQAWQKQTSDPWLVKYTHE